jgi:hypothetical protein
MPRQFGFYRSGRDIVGKLQFDRAESRSGGRAEALDQQALGEQMSEIGGKAGHGRARSIRVAGER